MTKVTSKREIEKIYRLNVDGLYKFLYYKCLNVQVAEDLTSESFMQLAIKIKSNTVIDDPVKYLYGIANRVWTQYLRDKYKIEVYDYENIDVVASIVDADQKTDDPSVSIEERALVFINKLPPKQQVVAYMRLIKKHSPKEIAVGLGTNTNDVKVTLRRALRNLERIIELGEPESETSS